MAKKLMKIVRPRKSIRMLFVETLVPWVVMAFVALGLVKAGMEKVLAFVVGIGAALAVTFLIWHLDKRQAALARARGHRSDRP